MRTFVLGFLAMTSCTDSSSATNELEFHGEQAVLPGFSLDTGMQPEGSPVQLQLVFSAGGSLSADARAIAGGDGDATTVAAVPGSGTFTLDAHIKLGGMLHVDVSGMTYDGPIPGIENLDIAFGGQTTFDPFLIGDRTQVSAMLPETKLPDIPLPGGLPGHLSITIAAGSVVSSELSGSCASMDGKLVKFLGSTSTSANLILNPVVVITVPVFGDKEFPLPAITVPIPAFDAAMDLGEREFAGGGEAPAGSSFATRGCGPADGGSGGGGGGGGGGGAGTCTPVAASFDSAWHPPNGLHSGSCTSLQLTRFDNECLGANATTETCQNFQYQNLSCSQCLITPSTSPGYGPLVVYSVMASYNLAGCIAAVTPNELTCAKTIQKFDACIDAACSGCDDSTRAELDACIADAGKTVCKSSTDPAVECMNRLFATPAATCFNDFNYEAQFCGQ